MRAITNECNSSVEITKGGWYYYMVLTNGVRRWTAVTWSMKGCYKDGSTKSGSLIN